MSAQPATQPFTARDARRAGQSYQHIAHVVDRLLNRLAQGVPEALARKYFKSSVVGTIHSLHGFFNGRSLSKSRPVIKAHRFVIPHFTHRGDVEKDANVSRFMGRHLDDLRAAELACGYDLIRITRGAEFDEVLGGLRDALRRCDASPGLPTDADLADMARRICREYPAGSPSAQDGAA